jgi:2-polyprenyl-3-methyl-5-hydroxy-6-metoxy-1,4-benzoquinol methylase
MGTGQGTRGTSPGPVPASDSRQLDVLAQSMLAFGVRACAVLIGIPALDGVEAKLTRGALVAEVGCGAGVSTLIMAAAYPRSRFFGFDTQEEAVEAARRRAQQSGLDERVRFEVAGATDYTGSGYDLVAHLDDLQVTGDAARHTRRTMAPDGTWMIVEAVASEGTADARLRPLVIAGGLSRLRCATRTPFHLILEARP